MRWLDTATVDLAVARQLAASGFHAHACFSAQQCAEKAAKAMWFATGGDPWGHSIQALIDEFPMKDSFDDVKMLREKARANQLLKMRTVGGVSRRRFVAVRRQNATNRRQESPPTTKTDRPWAVQPPC